VGQRCLGGNEDRADIDSHGLVEVGEGELVDRAQQQHTGIVDQDVDAAEPFGDAVDGRFESDRVGRVGLDRERGAAGAEFW
jgi:hypothetical protein